MPVTGTCLQSPSKPTSLDPTLYDFAIFADALNISGDNETAYRFDATYHLDDGLAINAGISFRDRERDWRRCCEWVVGPRRRHFGPIGSEGLGMVDIEYTVLPVDDLHSGISGIESPNHLLDADCRLGQGYISLRPCGRASAFGRGKGVTLAR